MASLSEVLLKNLKTIVFSSKLKPDRHKYIQNSLVYFFQELGFHTYREYKIDCLWKPRRKARAEENYQLKKGRIDIFAKYKDSFKIAIEFDSGKLVKMKSLEKLFQCNSKLCVAIISGINNTAELLKKENININFKRFKQVFQELRNHYTQLNDEKNVELIESKQMWLSIVNYQTFDEIKLT
ncbi:MAG: hypothetical protein HWN81_02935 [Candidatus Lokiarchaeota archaeon]|nr:hypothetical protein [Candidatus Lokiarchaeota archaeon]